MTTITASILEPEAYNEFLKSVLTPNLMLRGEILVYSYMEQLCEQYRGGSWKIIRLDNGAWYMAPKTPDPMHLKWSNNFFDGVMSADAAGIVATLFAINDLALSYELESLQASYNKLLDFAMSHPEAGLIGAAID